MSKIKIVLKGVQAPEIINQGDWIDLRAAEDTFIQGPYSNPLRSKKEGVNVRSVVINSAVISLGVAMELPKGYEAVVLPRSSAPGNFGVILANSQGVIDNSFNGDNDVWRFNAIALRDTTIHKGDRIAQFRIQLSQKASFWQKLKWLFSGCPKIEIVDTLGNEDRGGMGSTGVK